MENKVQSILVEKINELEKKVAQLSDSLSEEKTQHGYSRQSTTQVYRFLDERDAKIKDLEDNKDAHIRISAKHKAAAKKIILKYNRLVHRMKGNVRSADVVLEDFNISERKRGK